MAKVKAMTMGYYNENRIRPGQIFLMKEVDSDGHYIDAEGKKKLGKDGKPIKCKWVSVDLKAKSNPEKDPQEIARAISGKNAVGKHVEFDPEEELTTHEEQPKFKGRKS